MREFLHRLKLWLAANREDVSLFLLALFLASATWLIHNLALKYNEELTVQIVALSNIEGRMEKAVAPVEASATCRATGYRFLRFSMGGRPMGVKVRFAPEDLHYVEGDLFYITSDRLKNYSKEIFGTGLTVDHFNKDTLYFRFSSENCRKVPVHVVERTSFAPQYMSRHGLRVSPDSVTVYGEASRIDNIEEVFTDIISLRNLDSPADGTVSLETVPGVRFSRRSIDWSIDVQRFVEMDKVASIAVRNLPKNKSLILYPSKVQVRMKYLFPLVPDIEDVEIFYVDYGDFASSISGQCLIKADELPDGILGYELSRDIAECAIQTK